MLYAISNDQKIEPYPKANAICPDCSSTMVAKCGKVNAWHWAHVSKSDCDSWSEVETAWHLKWKSHFPKENVEISMEEHGEKHRADILSSLGYVIEVQHSPITLDKIMERQNFYHNLIWVFDVSEVFWWSRLTFMANRFQWMNSKKHVINAKNMGATIILDLGIHKLFEITQNFPAMGYGNGRFIDKKEFVEYHGGSLSDDEFLRLSKLGEELKKGRQSYKYENWHPDLESFDRPNI